MWVIGGVFFFVLLEMLFTQSLSEEEPEPAEREPEPEQQPAQNGAGELRRRQVGEHTALNGSVKGAAAPQPQPPAPRPPAKQVSSLEFRGRERRLGQTDGVFSCEFLSGRSRPGGAG